jgi:hypothetical protein
MASTFLTTPKAFVPHAFTAGIDEDVSLILEQYPKVGEKIQKTWGSAGLHNYLESIIFDERGGRHGFPESVVSALFRIYEGHTTLLPEIKRGDIWDVILERIK